MKVREPKSQSKTEQHDAQAYDLPDAMDQDGMR